MARDVDIGFPTYPAWERFRAKKTTHIVGSGAGEAVNLFMVEGAVKVYNFFGVVSDVTDVSAVTVAFLELYDDDSKPITKATGTDLSGMNVGSIIGRNAAAATALYLADASDGVIADGDLGSDFFAAFLALAQKDTDTYIRFNFTSDSGGYDFTIDWEIVWMPLSEGSTIVPVA